MIEDGSTWKDHVYVSVIDTRFLQKLIVVTICEKMMMVNQHLSTNNSDSNNDDADMFIQNL